MRNKFIKVHVSSSDCPAYVNIESIAAIVSQNNNKGCDKALIMLNCITSTNHSGINVIESVDEVYKLIFGN